MVSGPRWALLVVLSLSPAWLACGVDDPGRLRELTHYTVEMTLFDGANDGSVLGGPLSTKRGSRDLRFEFRNTEFSGSSQGCASLADAKVRFADQPVTSMVVGGWVVDRLDDVDVGRCNEPSVEMVFEAPQGEPQDGDLLLEDAGGHLVVPFNRRFGNASITLVSATREKMVVRLADFLQMPTLDAIGFSFVDDQGSSSRVAIGAPMSTDDGLLAVSVAAQADDTGPLRGALDVKVDFGRESHPCEGFVSCTTSSRMERALAVNLPALPSSTNPTPTLP
jgi:hypothetical protein